MRAPPDGHQALRDGGVSVVSSSPGEDGDYSNEATVHELRPSVDAACEAGVSVALDLQVGRTDFEPPQVFVSYRKPWVA